jgi:hypothetical protein
MSGPQDRQPALRDAARIAASVAADEAAADHARERLRAGSFEPDTGKEPRPDWLAAGERLIATRPHTLLRTAEHGPSAQSIAGELAVTTRRLVVRAASGEWSVSLERILELAPIGERGLLVTLDGLAGVTLDVARPRLLRVEIAATRAVAARAGAGSPGVSDDE